MDSNLLNERHTLKNKLQFKSLRTLVTTDICYCVTSAHCSECASVILVAVCWRVTWGFVRPRSVIDMVLMWPLGRVYISILNGLVTCTTNLQDSY